MELIAGMIGMFICWRGRAFKEIRLFFISFAMLTFYVAYMMVVSKFILPRFYHLGHEIYGRYIFIFYTVIVLIIYAVIYGTLLLGIYKTIKRFRGEKESKEEEKA